MNRKTFFASLLGAVGLGAFAKSEPSIALLSRPQKKLHPFDEEEMWSEPLYKKFSEAYPKFEGVSYAELAVYREMMKNDYCELRGLVSDVPFEIIKSVTYHHDRNNKPRLMVIFTTQRDVRFLHLK
ncbi:hypothetical protein MUK70_11815 [Dyadobacter chenwenxiniae]|uniref:DUF3887 domain-containing protein n=1 Tax=Dyadobacter chenwenxiniae TaxID=2906456 RepID=A0A9X1PI64_9BACT|nr:hypothetical protein [Dyadobacter chenwenxiniae]MCF0059928.1 hypothetical protein [Dyadobacter chenwenxiniae]UON85667.1 hypothetical protein MUK70_11815 [Dyadobacter chenwenxiniae]